MRRSFVVVAVTWFLAILVAAPVASAVTRDGAETASASAPAADVVRAQQESEEGVRGTLQDGEDEPVPDVAIIVSDTDGTEIGQATTDENGQWEVPVPGPGTYSVLLDEASLPEGVDLRDPDRNPAQVRVTSGRVVFAVFQLGEGDTGRGQLDAVARALANGVKIGLIIAMTSVGLSLIFSTTGLINFAHGELVAVGAMLAWFLNVGLSDRGGPGIQLIAAGALAIVGGGDRKSVV